MQTVNWPTVNCRCWDVILTSHVGMCTHVNQCWSDYLRRPLIPDKKCSSYSRSPSADNPRSEEFLQNWPPLRFRLGRGWETSTSIYKSPLAALFHKILMGHSNWINIASQSITWAEHLLLLNFFCQARVKVLFFNIYGQSNKTVQTQMWKTKKVKFEQIVQNNNQLLSFVSWLFESIIFICHFQPAAW